MPPPDRDSRTSERSVDVATIRRNWERAATASRSEPEPSVIVSRVMSDPHVAARAMMSRIRQLLDERFEDAERRDILQNFVAQVEAALDLSAHAVGSVANMPEPAARASLPSDAPTVVQAVAALADVCEALMIAESPDYASG